MMSWIEQYERMRCMGGGVRGRRRGGWDTGRFAGKMGRDGGGMEVFCGNENMLKMASGKGMIIFQLIGQEIWDRQQD